MKKRPVLVAVVALVLMGAGMVSANFVFLYKNTINAQATSTSSVAVNINVPYTLPGLNITITGSAPSGGLSVGDSYTVTVKMDKDTFSFKVDKVATTNRTWEILHNGAVIASLSSSALSAEYLTDVHVYIVNSTTVQLEMDNSQFANPPTYPLITLSATATINSTSLTEIDASAGGNATYTINTIEFYRYSKYLTSLTVKDENTNIALTEYDFSESGDQITVKDLSGTHIARTYYNVTGALTAYLVAATDGHWYSIFAGPQYTGQELQVLRNFNGVWVLVGESFFDSTGSTAMFLADGQEYMFRVLNSQKQIVLSQTAVVSPSNPTINLASGFESTSVTIDPTLKFAWVISPSDGYLYANKTNTVTVVFSSTGATVQNMTLILQGAGQNIKKEVDFNSPAGAFSVNITPTEVNTYVYATLEVAFSNGEKKNFLRSFFVTNYVNATQGSLLYAVKEVPKQAGLGTVGSTFVATIIVLLTAAGVARFAGSGAGLVVGAMAWIFFTYAGWVDWRITLISVLAGVGLMIRRGEA